jgi:hypothetical protein
MKHRNLMMVAVFVAGLGGLGGALAQGAGCGPEGRMGMKSGMMQDGMKQGGMMDPAARAEQRLTQLKDVIKPNAQQEPLWQAFAEKSKAEAEKGYKAMRERASQDKTMTAPERMAQMQNSMKDRAASMESVNESFKRLYAALSPEQKAVADKQFGALGAPGHKGHGGPARGGPGGPGGGQDQRKS